MSNNKHSNKISPYNGPHQHKDDAVNTFFSSVQAYYGTTDVGLIVGTKTLLTYVYAIGSKSGLNIAKFLQDRFHESGIPINIWSGNTQEEFMGCVRKLLCAYVVGRKKYKAHKKNQNPSERLIQETKSTTCTILDRSDTPSWSWILCMAYAVSIINCIAQQSLSWCTPHKAAYGFTPDIAHLKEFEFWEPILILYDNTHFPKSREIFGYYAGPATNKGAIDFY